MHRAVQCNQHPVRRAGPLNAGSLGHTASSPASSKPLCGLDRGGEALLRSARRARRRRRRRALAGAGSGRSRPGPVPLPAPGRGSGCPAPCAPRIDCARAQPAPRSGEEPRRRPRLAAAAPAHRCYTRQDTAVSTGRDASRCLLFCPCFRIAQGACDSGCEPT